LNLLRIRKRPKLVNCASMAQATMLLSEVETETFWRDAASTSGRIDLALSFTTDKPSIMYGNAGVVQVNVREGSVDQRPTKVSAVGSVQRAAV